jgi:hypothetical protein
VEGGEEREWRERRDREEHRHRHRAFFAFFLARELALYLYLYLSRSLSLYLLTRYLCADMVGVMLRESASARLRLRSRSRRRWRAPRAGAPEPGSSARRRGSPRAPPSGKSAAVAVMPRVCMYACVVSRIEYRESCAYVCVSPRCM